MPELPEVETTRRGLIPHIEGQEVLRIEIREPRLRWPIPENIQEAVGERIESIRRRGKYLLFKLPNGHLLFHLGMSGSLRLCSKESPWRKHDHLQIDFASLGLRLHDPRRFGCLLWMEGDPDQHSLLKSLGPEPLEREFNGRYLHAQSRGRKVPVKTLIMNGQIVVGVGNIYAQEALFMAGIHPGRSAGSISLTRYEKLADAIRTILSVAIGQGGTTLRDFVNGHGEPGYFQQQLEVYGRGHQPCRRCAHLLREIRQSGRSTVYCPHCQR